MRPEQEASPKPRSAWHDYRPHLSYFFLLFLANALFGPFLARYLDSIGFSKSAIGFVLGWTPVVALLVQPVWGVLGDRVRVKNSLLIGLLAANVVVIALFPLHSGVAWVGLLLVLLKVFQGPASNMSSTIALEDLKSRGREFGPVRMAGTIGYMAYYLALGPVLARWGFTAAFLLGAATLAASLVASLFLPKVTGHQTKAARVPYRALYGNPELILLVVFAALLMAMMYHYYNSATIYLRNLTGSDSLGALAIALSTVGEIPFLFLAGRIVRKLGIRRTLLGAGVMMGIRFLIWGFARNPVVLVASQLLHATNFIVLDYCLAVYINDKMPAELKATGQAFKAVVGFTLPLAVGSPIVGILSDVLGIQAVFRIGSVWFFAVTAVFGVLFARIGRRERIAAAPAA
jgi:MFS transporter, PPP family, 3-phenylpropionic acid transporter